VALVGDSSFGWVFHLTNAGVSGPAGRYPMERPSGTFDRGDPQSLHLVVVESTVRSA